MRCLNDFDPMDPGESEILAFNFVDDLDPTETIASASWEVAVISGTDGTPDSRKSGPAFFDDTRIYQRIASPQPGVTYQMRARAVTSAGNTKSLFAFLPTNVL